MMFANIIICWMQGGCGTCVMGAADVCVLCFLRSCFVFQVYEGCIFLSMCHSSYTGVHENSKESKTKQEE